ncbi:unnamed protein product [Echinostoma caproni]|uniref:PHM7_cyt domain-containing protein n=1 Tax=Echinostoma caproni TaxID=27848 RepID=A0A183AMY4_9TREM|nr:unnamed protein product [Echinostoma caproni]
MPSYFEISQGPWILWALALVSSILYLVFVGLRFEYAYYWPKLSGICRLWNEGAHTSSHSQLLINTDGADSSAWSTDSQIQINGPESTCQCLLVNQLVICGPFCYLCKHYTIPPMTLTPERSLVCLGQIPNVLMLSNVAEKPLNELEKEITSYFSSFDPPINVQWIRPLYDVYQIVTQERARLETEMLFQLAESEFNRTGRDPRFWHGFCGCGTCLKVFCASCCCCFPCVRQANEQSDLAREVYQERLLTEKIWLDGQYKRLAGLTQRPIGFTSGVVFVGLTNADEALRVATEFSIYLQRAIPTDYTIHPSTHTICLPVTRWSNMLLNKERARHYAGAPFGHLQLAPLPAEVL